MSLIGALLTGDGVPTVFSSMAQCEQYLLIGDIDTANPLEGLTVEIGGQPFIQITDQQALLTAYAKWMNAIAGGGVVGLMFRLATGCIKRTTTFRLTNAGVTTPNIYAFSDNDFGVPFVATTEAIKASSYMDFEKFSALFLIATNVSSAQINFASGRKETITAVELAALFVANNRQQAEANGLLGTATILDNRDQSITSIRIFVSVETVVLIAKIPDAAFKMIKAATA
jgi:hypothetical protein